MKKKLLSLILILIMIFSVSSTTMAAETEDASSGGTTIDTSTYYYDRYTNDAYREVYDQINQAAITFHTSTANAEYAEKDEKPYYKAFTLSVSKKNWDVIGSDGVQLVIQGVLADHPEYFWMSEEFEYQSQTSEAGNIYYLVSIFCYSNYANGTARQVLKNDIDLAIQSYANLTTDDMADYEKEYIIHNAIIGDIYTNTTIQEKTDDTIWAYTIDGVFNPKYHNAVSFGYAKAFKVVMDYLGIPCIYIEGTETVVIDNDKDDTNRARAWNAVYLDNDWYLVDVCGDDPETTTGKDVLMYDYFNITSSQAADLVPNEAWLQSIPTCKGTEYSISMIQSQLEKKNIWQEDNYNFFDKILDTYGLSVVLISIGLILLLFVLLVKHIHKRRKTKAIEKIKKTKTSVVDHTELDEHLRRPPLS